MDFTLTTVSVPVFSFVSGVPFSNVVNQFATVFSLIALRIFLWFFFYRIFSFSSRV